MENLRKLIYSHGNQKIIAKELNISPQTFNNYVNGKTNPDITTLIKLADYFHVTLDELVGRPTSIINKMLLTDKERSIIEKVLAMDIKQQELTEFYIDTLMKSI